MNKFKVQYTAEQTVHCHMPLFALICKAMAEDWDPETTLIHIFLHVEKLIKMGVEAMGDTSFFNEMLFSMFSGGPTYSKLTDIKKAQYKADIARFYQAYLNTREKP